MKLPAIVHSPDLIHEASHSTGEGSKMDFNKTGGHLQMLSDINDRIDEVSAKNETLTRSKKHLEDESFHIERDDPNTEVFSWGSDGYG